MNVRDFGVDVWAAGLCLLVFVCALTWDLAGTSLSAERARRWGLVCVVVLLGSAHRLVFVEPAFVHAEFRGPELITDVLRFVQDRPRHPYGPMQYLVLGGLAHGAFTPDVEGVLLANLLVSTLAGLAFAAMAARLFPDARAGLYAALLFASSPLVARLARSEDAHGIALFFGSIAAIYVDRAVRERSRSALLVGALAMVLMAYARESFYGWIPMLVALAMRGRDPAAPSERWRVAPRVLVAAALAHVATVTIAARGGGNGFVMLLLAHLRLVLAPKNLLTCFAMHPVFDLPGPALPLLALFVVGAVTLAKRAELPRAALGLGLGLLFLATLPATWPSHGPRWGFHVPFYALFLLVGALGACRLEALAAGRIGARPTALALGLALTLPGLLGGAARANQRPDGEFRDYVWLRDTLLAERGRRDVGVVGLFLRDPAPRYTATREVTRLLDVALASTDELASGRLDPRRTWLFHEGLGCSAYTVYELLLPDAPDFRPFLEDPARMDLVFFGLDEGFGRARVRVPTALRAPCRSAASFASGPAIVGPAIAIHDDPPFAVLGRTRFRPRLLPVAPAR